MNHFDPVKQENVIKNLPLHSLEGQELIKLLTPRHIREFGLLNGLSSEQKNQLYLGVFNSLPHKITVWLQRGLSLRTLWENYLTLEEYIPPLVPPLVTGITNDKFGWVDQGFNSAKTIKNNTHIVKSCRSNIVKSCRSNTVKSCRSANTKKWQEWSIVSVSLMRQYWTSLNTDQDDTLPSSTFDKSCQVLLTFLPDQPLTECHSCHWFIPPSSMHQKELCCLCADQEDAALSFS